MKVTFVNSVNIARNIYKFSFQADKKPKHIAGQFIELYLPHENKDNRGDKRWFTLSSSPTEEYLAITTKFAGENGSSFKKTLKNLAPGTELNMASPMGDFVLPKDRSIPLVFVAGGIGCTPFHSITKYLIDTGEKRDITLIYNANSPEDIAFKDDFDYYAERFIQITGQRLTGQKILDLAGPSEKNRYFYLSGPEPMIENLQKELKNLGINRKNIFTDFFPGYVIESI